MLELRTTANLREELEQLLQRATLENPIIVSRRTLRTALQRLSTNDLVSDDLMIRANAIEAHDQVQYEPGFEELIADVVFGITSREINGPLDSTSCLGFISQLG
jgi:hypothetical protein